MGTKYITEPVTLKSFDDAAINSFIALDKEIFIDRTADKTTLRIGDGVTPGGLPVYKDPVGSIASPVIISPISGLTNVFTDIDITSSLLSGLNENGTAALHGGSYWEIATDSGFSTVVYRSGLTSSDLTSINILNAHLEYATTYYVRVR